jgi:hypothetical protein
MDWPEDIQKGWMNVIRRLQSVSKSQGLSIIEIRVLVDEGGNPIAWAEPKQTKIEPRKSVAMFFELIK